MQFFLSNQLNCLQWVNLRGVSAKKKSNDFYMSNLKNNNKFYYFYELKIAPLYINNDSAGHIELVHSKG